MSDSSDNQPRHPTRTHGVSRMKAAPRMSLPSGRKNANARREFMETLVESEDVSSSLDELDAPGTQVRVAAPRIQLPGVAQGVEKVRAPRITHIAVAPLPTSEKAASAAPANEPVGEQFGPSRLEFNPYRSDRGAAPWARQGGGGAGGDDPGRLEGAGNQGGRPGDNTIRDMATIRNEIEPAYDHMTNTPIYRGLTEYAGKTGDHSVDAVTMEPMRKRVERLLASGSVSRAIYGSRQSNMLPRLQAFTNELFTLMIQTNPQDDAQRQANLQTFLRDYDRLAGGARDQRLTTFFAQLNPQNVAPGNQQEFANKMREREGLVKAATGPLTPDEVREHIRFLPEMSGRIRLDALHASALTAGAAEIRRVVRQWYKRSRRTRATNKKKTLVLPNGYEWLLTCPDEDIRDNFTTVAAYHYKKALARGQKKYLNTRIMNQETQEYYRILNWDLPTSENMNNLIDYGGRWAKGMTMLQQRQRQGRLKQARPRGAGARAQPYELGRRTIPVIPQ